MNFLYWLIPLLFVAYVLVQHVLRIPLRLRYRKFPGEPFSPFFGHQQKYQKDTLNYDVMLANKYPKWCIRFFGADAQLVITNPELFRKAASSDHRRPMYKVTEDISNVLGFHDTFKYSIFGSNGELWRDLRNLFMPAFSTPAMKSYTKTVLSCVDDHVDELRTLDTSGEMVELLDFTKSIALQIIMKTAFGVDMDLKDEQNREDLIQLRDLSLNFFVELSKYPLSSVVALCPELMRPMLYYLSGTNVINTLEHARQAPGRKVLDILKRQKSEQLAHEIHSHQEIIKELHKDVQKSNTSDQTSDSLKYASNIPQKPGMILDLIYRGVSQGKVLDQQTIVSNLTVFLITGHATTATALAFAIYEISQNKYWEKELLAEIDANGAYKKITDEDLPKFPVAKAIINETLRLHSPLLMTGRGVTSKNSVIDGQDIPKGTNIILPIRGIHLSEHNWPKALEFHPGRWLGQEEFKSKTQIPAFYPFGWGPRMCLGMKLANEEAMIALIKIYQNYTFTIPHATQNLGQVQALALVPNKKMLVEINKRVHQKS